MPENPGSWSRREILGGCCIKPEYRAPWTGTTRCSGSALEKSRDSPTPRTFGHFPFGIVFLLCPFSPCAFHPYQRSLSSPQPLPGRPKPQRGERGLTAPGPSPGFGQALPNNRDRFPPGVQLHLQPENEPPAQSRPRAQRVALWSRGPKCCHVLFCSRETQYMSESLLLRCPGRSGQKDWSKHRAWSDPGPGDTQGMCLL